MSRNLGAYVLMVLGLLLPCLVLRGVLLDHFGLELAAVDRRGLTSDLGVCLFFAGLVSLIPKRGLRLTLAVLLSGFWMLFQVASFENILALQSSLNFAYIKFATDTAMLKGSVLRLTSPATVAVSASLCVFFILGCIHTPSWKWRVGFFVLGVAGLNRAITFSVLPSFPNWRQYHVVAENLRFFVRTHQSAKAKEQKEHQTQTLGEAPGRRGFTHKSPPNILLLMLEGVGGMRLEDPQPAGAYHSMEFLRSLAEQSYWVRNGVAPNRQTNRGEYALLCGDLPNLKSTESKMDMYQAGSDLPCLPQVLADHGYGTYYLQAAPLNFMNKDRFMREIGFQHAFGVDWFKEAELWGAWGPDDRSFFRGSISMLEQLRQAGKPWFLTMLTVGTHHPFVVPASFRSPFAPDTLDNSMAYLDFALREFWQQVLVKLPNTLVIVTADESAGIDRADVPGSWYNWIPMIFHGPNVQAGRAEALFSQHDLMASVLDYLGLTKVSHPAGGRSVFRHYDSPRMILYGNTYHRRLGYFQGRSSYVGCRDQLEGCRVFHWQDGPFSAEVEGSEQPLEGSGFAERVRQNEWFAN